MRKRLRQRMAMAAVSIALALAAVFGMLMMIDHAEARPAPAGWLAPHSLLASGICFTTPGAEVLT